jgi:hypothetical protein
MKREFNGPLVFGDMKAISFIKRIQKDDITKKKITISYDSLLKIGVEKSQALDLIQRLLNYKKK